MDKQDAKIVYLDETSTQSWKGVVNHNRVKEVSKVRRLIKNLCKGSENFCYQGATIARSSAACGDAVKVCWETSSDSFVQQLCILNALFAENLSKKIAYVIFLKKQNIPVASLCARTF